MALMLSHLVKVVNFTVLLFVLLFHLVIIVVKYLYFCWLRFICWWIFVFSISCSRITLVSLSDFYLYLTARGRSRFFRQGMKAESSVPVRL